MSEDEKKTEEEEEQATATRKNVIYVDESSDIEDPLHLLQVQLEAQFQHFRSESYTNSVAQLQVSDEDEGIKGASTEAVASSSAERSPSFTVMSLSPSPASMTRIGGKMSGKSFPSQSVSAPSSPKAGKSVSKASTLPHSATPLTRKSSKNGGFLEGATPKKSRSAMLCSLFKRLSPKIIKRSSSKEVKDKPWIVVEFSDKDIEDGATSDTGSAGSDRSFEMAVMHREEQLKKQRAKSCSGSANTDVGSMDSIRVGPIQSMTSSHPQLQGPSSAREPEVEKDSSRKAKRSRSLSEDKTFLSRLSQHKVLQILTPKKFVKSNGQISVCEEPVANINTTVQPCDKKFVAPTVILSQVQEQQPCESGQLPPPLMKTEGQLKVDQSSIPRVYRTHQPPKTLNILNKIVVPKTQVEKFATRMASVESIGSCSLDVDATASDSSGTAADGMTISQRTLVSGSLAIRSGSGGEGKTTEVEKTIVRMPEEKFVTRLYVPEVNGTDGGESSGKEDETDATCDGSKRQPSYVNLSCSVSGYTSYACYNSKVREGLRSRDASPARAVFSNVSSGGTSLDSSHKPLGIKTLNADLQRLQLTNGSGHHNGELKHGKSGSATERPESQRKTRYEHSLNHPETNLEQPKSLVEQRIERLYGPGALAQGFLIRAKARNLYGGVTTTTSTAAKKTSEMNGSSGRLNHEVSSMLEGKPVGKLVAAVLASPSLLPRSATSSPAVSPSWHAESIAQATASFSPPGHRKHDSTPEKRQVNGHSIGIHLESGDINSFKDQQGNEKDAISLFTKTNDVKEKNGNYFMDLMSVEQKKIESLIREAEKKLEDGSITDDAMAGRFRAAIGKANLLLDQKFKQFRGLCEKNITQLPSEPFPTTASDLEGFWDMVLLQVENIFVMFREINVLRDEQWNKSQTCEVDGASSTPKISNGVKAKRSSQQIKKIVTPSPKTPKAEEAARAREEARKRLAEAKRQARSKLTANKSMEQEVEIFAPETKQ